MQSKTHSPAVTSAWGFDKSDLAPDPAVRYGVLDNGMRYAIRHNETPQDSAVIRFLFDIGSMAEENDQRGLAHFIEHMAFNGTTNVPEGEMVKILERYGLAFGADTNAFTGYDRTGYTLDLPNVEAGLIDTALFLMRETASEILFEPEAVDRERGVILSERRTRDNYALRSFNNRVEFLLPDTKLPVRSPIGTEEVLKTAPAQRLRDFYEAYYTPGRATLIIVGDVDVDAIEQKIKSKFGDWAAKNGEIPDPDYGHIDFDRTEKNNEFTNPAIGETVSLVRFSPYKDKADTAEERRQNLLRNIGYSIISRRIGRAIRSGNAPFTSVRIGSSDIFEISRETSLTVSAKDGEVTDALAAAEKMVRTALTYGFTEVEIAEQIANFRSGQENAVKSANTRRSTALASAIIGAAGSDSIVTTPESSLERFNAAVPAITPENVLAAVKADLVSLDRPLVHVTSKAGVDGGPEKLRQVYLTSLSEPVSPLEDKDVTQFAYTNFGTPGKVVQDSRIDDLDIRTVTFENNVRLNIKKTDFEDDRVRISLRADGGGLLDTAENPHGTALINIFGNGGLEAHSVDDMLSLLAGRSVSLGFSSGSDYFGSYVTTTPKDMQLQLQLLTAYMTAPGYREEAVTRYRKSIPNYYARINATPGSALGYKLGAILSNNDPRFTPIPREDIEKADFTTLRETISNRLENGAIEVGIVGDIDEQQVISAVAATLGALPAREAEFLPYNTNRKRSFTADRSVRKVYHTGQENQAILNLYWPTTDDKDYPRDAGLTMLASILRLRLTERLREELGATYSPSASSATSSLYPGYGYLAIGGNVDFADIDKVADVISQIVSDMRENTATQDELERARTPILERITDSRRENGRWIGIVDEAQSEPRALDRFRKAEAVYKAITPSDIMVLAQEYLDPADALRIESVHENKK
ncbi:M16 family metallopeptidase [Sphingorhabdus sp. Alg239-R122]|uniref:M16 family metallopeptidase n=1 Tax=Sphingorhabdus sp. Alg239-R122 TaxID=2305989 RepID=UPI0019675632|nr:M16 family metallopeptidase [Sphingorhabdus sp. Alg239-R122]